MADIAGGNFLGGFARGSARGRSLALAARESDRADRKLTFQERLDEQTAVSERRLQTIGEINARIKSTLEMARASVEQIDAGGGGRTPEQSRALIAPLRESAMQLAANAQANNLPIDADLVARSFDLIASRPTPANAARAAAATDVAGQEARAAALVAQGVSEDVARREAFGLPASAAHFGFLNQDELAAIGFPPRAVVQRNETTGEVKVISEGGLLSPGDIVRTEQDLRRDFDKQSKAFEKAQQNFLAMGDLAQDTTGASDVALVFSFFKTIDPTSTVREGEFATAAQAAGLPAQFIQSFARLDSGEILPPELRRDLVTSAGRFYRQRLTDQQAREGFYRDLASSAGVQPGNVVRSRIRVDEAGKVGETGKFAGMTAEQLNAVDIDSLSDDEVRQLDAELSARGL